VEISPQQDVQGVKKCITVQKGVKGDIGRPVTRNNVRFSKHSRPLKIKYKTLEIVIIKLLLKKCVTVVGTVERFHTVIYTMLTHLMA
jgi:hypothetical protein